MKKIVPAFFIMCFIISCTKSLLSSSDWQNKKVTVDGNIPEWSVPLRFYDEKNGINYTISNDHQNLYLCCSISNEQLQLKILYSGIEFAIDTLGKKTFPIRIKYPLSTNLNPVLIKNTNTQTASGSKGKFDRSAFKLKLLAEETDMQLTGFKPPLVRVISMSDQNKTGISAAIDFDKMGTMCYEAVIPFSTFYKNELTPTDSNIVFNYRIKVNPSPNINSGQSRGNGMRGGGMGGGGMRGGGMRGGEMSGGGMHGSGMHGSGMRGSGMGGSGMGGVINGSEMYGDNGENGRQRSTSVSGTTKIETKLKLAYR